MNFSFNSFLLSTFASAEPFGSDLESVFKRFRILSNIYANLALLFIVTSYSIFSALFAQTSNNLLIPSVCIPSICISLYLLRRRHYALSSLFLLLTMSAGNFTTNYNVNAPVAALCSVILLPHFIFYSTSSEAVQIINLFLCIGLSIYNSIEVKRIFQVTLDDEQAMQVNLLVLSSFLTLVTTCLFCIFQKSVEKNIRHSADLNYQKAENVTKEVVEVMRTKDAFVSMLSHELRNPLNALKGSLDYLGDVIKDTASLKILKNAKLSCEVLLNLVNNVLDAAKLKSDKMEIICEEADIVDVIRKALTINSKALKDKNLFAQVMIAESFPKKIWVDPSRILQLFMNLISNAVKFTPVQGKIYVYISWCSLGESREDLLNPFDKKVAHDFSQKERESPVNENVEASSAIFNEFSMEEARVRSQNFKHMSHEQQRDVSSGASVRNRRADFLNAFDDESDQECWIIQSTKSLNQSLRSDQGQQKGYLKVQITDTGCGIPSQNIPKLFGMFEQVSQNVRSEHGGTGLGLWICKQLCQKMKGDITIYSKLKQGTTFVFYVTVNNDRINSNQLAPRFSPENEIRALVVDDQSVNCYLLSLLLEREGIKVQMAIGGQEGVEKFINAQRNSYFNFILMDVSMPQVDGFMAARAIREWETKNNRPQVDIYFISGEFYHEEDILAEFRRKQGKMDPKVRFLKKPIDGNLLKRCVLSQYKLKND